MQNAFKINGINGTNAPILQIVRNDVIKDVINGSQWYNRKM